MKSIKSKITKIEGCYVVEESDAERKRNYEISDEFQKQFVEYIMLALRDKLMNARSRTTSGTKKEKLLKA